MHVYCCRLQQLVDDMERFERDAAELEAWLATAAGRLHILADLSEPEVASLGAIKRKMELVLDFRKQLEARMPARSHVTTLGAQLLRCRPRDLSVEQRLASMEVAWLEVVGALPNNEAQLHAAQMELLPSRQALNELLLWLDSIDQLLADDADVDVETTLVDVGTRLHKYVDLKVDLANKQLTVDFVNKSSTLDVTSGDAGDDVATSLESTNFADKLDELNSRYHDVTQQVRDTIAHLQELQERWLEHDKAVTSLQVWFTDQEAKLSRFSRVGHEISVRNSLKDCQLIAEQLQAKQRDIDGVKVMCKVISERCTSPHSVERALTHAVNALRQQCTNLDAHLQQVRATLDLALTHWEDHHRALEQVNHVLTHTEYSLHRHRHASCDLVTFRNSIEQVKVSDIGFCVFINSELLNFVFVCTVMITVK